MFTVVAVGILAIMFAYVARIKKLRFCLQISFFVIFLFLALRYNYGNDYKAYFEMFYDISQLSLDFETIKNIWTNSILANMFLPGSDDLQVHVLSTEPGWLMLCILFRPFGFFAMVACLALFNCMVYYTFIKKYVPPDYYWFAVFLYVFSPNLMLVQMVVMRQSVAIAIFLISIQYILKKDFLRYALLILVATLFHTTALILLPLYLLGVCNFKINTFVAIGIISLFVCLFLLTSPLSQVANVLVSSYAPKYEVYQGTSSTVSTGLGVILNILLLIMLLLFIKYQDAELALLFKISILEIFVIPLAMVVMMFSRIGFYFLPVIMAVYPSALVKTKKAFSTYPLPFKYAILITVISWNLFLFWTFFQSDAWKASFSIYNSILSSPTLY